MNTKLALSMGCMALMASLSSLAHADSISFSFFSNPAADSVTATASALNASSSSSALMAISTTSLGLLGSLQGTLSVSTGAATGGSFTQTNLLTGVVNYGTGSGTEVEITTTSADCGSSHVCLTGVMNQGNFQVPVGNGSFNGTFTVTGYSSTLLTELGLPAGTTLGTGGSDSFDTANDTYNSGPNTDTSNFAGGTVTVSIVIPNVDTPEPDSLMLFGSGLLGMAGFARRKMMAR